MVIDFLFLVVMVRLLWRVIIRIFLMVLSRMFCDLILYVGIFFVFSMSWFINVIVIVEFRMF